MSKRGFFPAGSVTTPLIDVVPLEQDTLHWVLAGHMAPWVPPLLVPPLPLPLPPIRLPLPLPVPPPLPLPPLLPENPLPFFPDPPQPEVEPKLMMRAPPRRAVASMDS